MLPRNEYPRLDMRRGDGTWVCLNGEWEWEFDEEGEVTAPDTWKEKLDSKITVPFVPESELSGVGYTGYMRVTRYRRTFRAPEGFDPSKSRLILRFGAVDHHAWVWVNGELATEHAGGYVPFDADITDILRDGENLLEVGVYDDTRDPRQPTGKQCYNEPSGCHYTRCTGIWQTVWLEAVPRTYIKRLKMTPDVDSSRLEVVAFIAGDPYSGEIAADVSLKYKPVTSVRVKFSGGIAKFDIPLENPVLWDVRQPNLYDLTVTVGEDRVDTYFGMRKVGIDGNRLMLNGRPVFQRLVLDQGYYPDGIYTAKHVGEIRRDIELSMSAGFNGARLHMKVFEPAIYYYADHLGYLLWGEYPNWGTDYSRGDCLEHILPEWLTAMRRDYNHPSLVAWCPMNETHTHIDPPMYRNIYEATKDADPYRPVIDTSGYTHVITDIFDVHDYTQDPVAFARLFEGVKNGTGDVFKSGRGGYFEKYEGQPYFVSEFGGIRWDVKDSEASRTTTLDIDKDTESRTNSWGYGRTSDLEEFYTRLDALCEVLLSNPNICGFCYTQLTDVMQEMNGIFTYDRRLKFDMRRLYGIFNAPAAIEG